MASIRYRLIEFLIIFIFLPILFALKFSIWIKVAIGVFGLLYVIFILIRIENIKFQISQKLNWSVFFKHTLVKLSIIILITTTFVWFTDKEALFNVFLNKPKLWIFILFIYSFFSVYPQELIYRTFFYQRYNSLFKSSSLLLFINAIVFSLGHIFFRNTLVLVLTFMGGLLFAFTFSKTKSTLLVSIEHAIYGCWLFTIGMGEMLGFPS